MSKAAIWFVPAFLVTLGIFLLSTFLTIPMQVEGVSYLDKIEHSFAYFVLIVSFMIAFRKAELLTASRSKFLLIASTFYGFGLELVQYSFFHNRYFEWIDAAANILGCIVGFGVFKLFDRG